MAVGKPVKKDISLKKYLNALAVLIVYILSAQKYANEKDVEDGGDKENDLGIYFYLGLALISGYAFCDAFTSNCNHAIYK